jgi:hypothetical protein
MAAMSDDEGVVIRRRKVIGEKRIGDRREKRCEQRKVPRDSTIVLSPSQTP